MMNQHAVIDELRLRIETAEAEIRQRPIIGAAGDDAVLQYGTIVAAGTIIGSLKGCKFLTSELTALASAWDPVTIGAQAFEAGVGVFQPYGGAAADRVLIIHDASRSLSGHQLPAGERVAISLADPVTLPVTGSSPTEYKTLYRVQLP